MSAPSPTQIAAASRSAGTPLGVRIAVLIAAVGLAITSRIDAVVAVAAETGWIDPAVFAQHAEEYVRDATGEIHRYCDVNVCPETRLDAVVFAVYVIVSVIVLTATLVALGYFARRFHQIEHVDDPEKPGTTRDRWKPPATAVFNTIVGVATLGVLLIVVRIFGASGWNYLSIRFVGLVPVPSVIAGLFWGGILLTLFAAAMLLRAWVSDSTVSVNWKSFGQAVSRQRANLLVIVAFALLLLVVPLSVDQTGDALRFLSLLTPSGVAQSLFLVAGAALLSVTVLESWRAASARRANESPAIVPAWFWLAVAAGLVQVAVLLTLWQGSFSVLFVPAGLSVVLAAFELASGRTPVDPPHDDISAAESVQFERIVAATPLVILAIAVLNATVDLWATRSGGFEAQQLIGPVAVAVVLVVLALIATKRPSKSAAAEFPSRTGQSPVPEPEARSDAMWLRLLLLVVIPLTAVAVVLLGISLAAGEGFAADATRLAGAACAAVAMTFALVVVMSRPGLPTGSLRAPIPFAFLAGAVVLVIVHIAPIHFPRMVGAVFVVMVFLAAVVAIGSGLTILSFRWAAPGTLRWFGVSRFPVLTLLLVWWIVAGVTANPALHNIRTTEGSASFESPTLRDAFDAWVAAQPEFAPGADATGADVVPLVLVATHGGGIRAAYWTGLVLDCVVGSSADIVLPPSGTSTTLDEERRFNDGLCTDDRRDFGETQAAAARIFVASGVSGGAVGLAAYGDELLEGEFENGWVDDRLADDFLSPVLGWALFHDLPNHFIGLAPGPNGECLLGEAVTCLTQDRAAVLEESFSRMGDDDAEPLLRESWRERESDDQEVAARATSLPVFAFNSSTTGSPFRAVTSQVALGGGVASGAVDVGTMICPERDLTLTTAGVLAARFPYVSPSGIVGGECSSRTATSQLADGGYLENSGTQTLLELLPELTVLVEQHNASTAGPRIAIVVMRIDNDYQSSIAYFDESRPAGETVVPPQIVLSGGPAYQDAAIAALRDAVGAECYVKVSPELLPGVRAPLGWALSEGTRQSLVDGLTASYPNAEGQRVGEKANAIRTVQNWLEAVPEADADSRYERPLAPCVPD